MTRRINLSGLTSLRRHLPGKKAAMESDTEALQNAVDNIFGNYLVTDNHEPFIQFGDSSMKQQSLLLKELSAAGAWSNDPQETLKSVISLALDLITKKMVNPRLVKLVLGIYLTHSKEAHNLDVVVPPIKDHAEFKGKEDQEGVPLSNPVTPDSMKGFGIVSYFREDYDFNDHHARWHSVYPASGILESDGKTYRRAIDRQGELFLYMHSQMVSRYNAELLSWDLDMTHAWGYDDVLTFGYTPAPLLRSSYGARPPFRGWFENHSPKMAPKLVSHFPPKQEMITWRNNIFKAIEDNFFYTKKRFHEAGKFVLTEENAMNWVGIVVEAESPALKEVSPGSGEYIDRILYGNLHNLGHNKFAEIGYHEYTSDKNNFGVMLDNLGSPRDPCFWLWHAHIDDFRQIVVKKYVHSLNQHKPDVKITDLKIIPRDATSKTPAGGIATYLGPPQLELKEVNAKISHEPYMWEVKVESFRSTPPDKSDPQVFTVRLFIAPKALIQDQRAWIEMDKFTHTLTKLSEKITRVDTVSSVARKTPQKGEKLSSKCLCGWPQSMMLPIGTPSGIEYVGFAMLTDDKLSKSGTQALSFCGSSDDKYPDPRGMGYPFDKTWANREDCNASVEEIIDRLPHTKLCDFKIYRYVHLYEDSSSSKHPKGNITWEKNIKGFFTDKDVECMKGKFHLDEKEDVVAYAGEIYAAVKSKKMPQNEASWNEKKVAEFKQWMDDGCP